MDIQEQVNELKQLLDNHYYEFIKQIKNLEEENLDINGIINIFINNFDNTINRPLDKILEKNNIYYSYELQKYLDYEENR